MSADPPRPFKPDIELVGAGMPMFRVHSGRRAGNAFNPGIGSPTRFAFFGEPVVPVLYGAQTEQAALSESVLHDVPLTGGVLLPSMYRARRMSRLIIRRELRLASLLGPGLRKLGVRAGDVTATDPSEYGSSVRWAEAAHAVGLDGVAYMSRQCNSDRAYVLFGDRIDSSDIEIDSSGGWRLDDELAGIELLITLCAAFGVDVAMR